MQLEIHPEAEQEVEQAALWYEQMQSGLGAAFLREFETGLLEIQGAPENGPVFQGNDRILNFRYFPYAMVYQLQGGKVFIMAVMRFHRRPFDWTRGRPKL